MWGVLSFFFCLRRHEESARRFEMERRKARRPISGTATGVLASRPRFSLAAPRATHPSAALPDNYASSQKSAPHTCPAVLPEACPYPCVQARALKLPGICVEERMRRRRRDCSSTGESPLGTCIRRSARGQKCFRSALNSYPLAFILRVMLSSGDCPTTLPSFMPPVSNFRPFKGL